jgi:hypothetical protein
MVFQTKKELRDADLAHKKRYERIWRGVEPLFNADKIRKLSEFLDEA